MTSEDSEDSDDSEDSEDRDLEDEEEFAEEELAGHKRHRRRKGSKKKKKKKSSKKKKKKKKKSKKKKKKKKKSANFSEQRSNELDRAEKMWAAVDPCIEEDRPNPDCVEEWTDKEDCSGTDPHLPACNVIHSCAWNCTGYDAGVDGVISVQRI